MSIIEGIGDEVTHFFIALLVIVIVTLAWWTTNISEQRHVRTVLLLERRRHRSHRRLTNHTETVTISEGSAQVVPAVQETVPWVEDTVSVNEEPSTSNSDNKQPNVGPESTETSREAQSIIESMDSDTCVVRQRRLAFYDNYDDNATADQPQASTQTEKEPLMEHNYAEHPGTSDEGNVEKKPATEITIKLKYINDDLKLVQGKLDEQLGDFKKRHFQPELAANKLVRLIFNGQVLQQDTQTLADCGLFDNCVVHCLIHRKITINNESTVHESRREGYSFPNSGTTNFNNNNQNRDWDLGNFLFAFISFILLAAWYFRYVYAHLYTVTATIGLILITGIFTIVLVGMYFPENENLPNPTIRIARERVQPQQ